MYLIVTDIKSFEYRGMLKALGLRWSAPRKHWYMQSTNEERLDDTAIVLEENSIQYVKTKFLPKLTQGHKNYLKEQSASFAIAKFYSYLKKENTVTKIEFPLNVLDLMKSELKFVIEKYIQQQNNLEPNTCRAEARVKRSERRFTILKKSSL